MTVSDGHRVNPGLRCVDAVYISQFHARIMLDVNSFDVEEFYHWCSESLGKRYRDWFVVQTGPIRRKVLILHVRSAKKSTLVRLKYNQAIIQSVDL